MNTVEVVPAAAESPMRDAPGADEILDIALCMGEALLHAGSDVHRVEDTMTRVCTAYGCARSDVFVIPTMIMADVTLADGSTVHGMRRVGRTYTHLTRLEEINALSRSICASPLPADEVKRRLADIRARRPVPEWLCYIGGLLATGSFTLFFGGTWRDGLCASLIGLLMILAARHPAIRLAVNDLGRTSITSFFAGLLAVLSVAVGLGQHVDMVIVGTIMLEIPGLSMGNAIRDLLCGDLISGLLRFCQSVLCALVMALSYIAALALTNILWGGLAL